MSSEVKCWMYWIHLPGVHTDITTQGYVGITTRSVAARYSCHKSHAKSGKKTRLYDAMRKYGDSVEVETVLVGTLAYCRDLEHKLRSTKDLAWNTGIGGEKPTVGYRHSDETKRAIGLASKRITQGVLTRLKIGAAHKGKVVSQETKDRQSVAAKARSKYPWINPAANKLVWAGAENIAEYVTANPTKGVYLVGKHFSLPQDSVSKIVANVKSGWNPYTDEAYQLWLTQHKQKECNESTQTP